MNNEEQEKKTQDEKDYDAFKSFCLIAGFGDRPILCEDVFNFTLKYARAEASAEIEKLREELSQKEKQIDILCDGMDVQREQIKALKDDLEWALDQIEGDEYGNVKELKKKHKLGK